MDNGKEGGKYCSGFGVRGFLGLEDSRFRLWSVKG